MRGKAGNVLREDLPHGITPAYAGKSHQHFCTGHVRRDHPRLCGEKAYLITALYNATGSPPPMRGKADTDSVPMSGGRITPAYAGKSRMAM